MVVVVVKKRGCKPRHSPLLLEKRKGFSVCPLFGFFKEGKAPPRVWWGVKMKEVVCLRRSTQKAHTPAQSLLVEPKHTQPATANLKERKGEEQRKGSA